MIRLTYQFFIWSFLILTLTSCGTKEQISPVSTTHPTSKPIKKQPSSLPSQEKTHKVALLVPLTGPHAELGKSLLNAAELALFESESSHVTLLPKDTNLGPHQAALKALDEGAELLLGPIFSHEVQTIKPLVAARNINLISFSTDKAIAKKGIFVLGLLPSQQIERVILHAKEKGIIKIAVLTPGDQYGKVIDQTIKDLELKGDIQLIGTTHYSKGDLLEGNPGNIRIQEDVESFKEKGMHALVIPEGGENLTFILKLLSSQGPLKVLGSGQWDSPETLKIAPVINEGYFASTSPHERQAFESRFQKTYNYAPPRIATLAYDAVALAVALANQGYKSQSLSFSQGFSGVEGLFRLTPQGLNDRGLAILAVTPSGFKTISEAPKAF